MGLQDFLCSLSLQMGSGLTAPFQSTALNLFLEVPHQERNMNMGLWREGLWLPVSPVTLQISASLQDGAQGMKHLPVQLLSPANLQSKQGLSFQNNKITKSKAVVTH